MVQINPAIMFHHGNGNASRDWKFLNYIDELIQDYYLIFIDFFGYGNSDKSHNISDYDIEHRLADSVAVLDTCAPTNKVYFYGGSMGGQLAFNMALHTEYNHKFSGYISNGGAAQGSGPLSTEMINLLENAKTKGMEYYVTQLENSLGRKFPAGVRDTFIKNDIDAYICSIKNSWPNCLDKLNKISQPFLLLVGEMAEERILIETCHHKLRNSKLVILSKLNHAEAYWSGSIVVNHIKNFVSQFNHCS